jgi:hypothetical protein
VNQAVNIVIGLSTALIGYVIGRVWQRIVERLRHRRLKHFLAPLLDGGASVVVSRFTHTEFPEPTGLVGGGDALAMRELSTAFSDVGFKNYRSLYVDERDLDRRENLILLGGMDTNRITKDAVELIKPGLLIHDPGPGIKMEIHDVRSSNRSQDRHRSSRLAVNQRYKASDEIDYGVIIRAPNPFNTNKGLIIIAGAYGYGSWAGALLIRDKLFLEKCAELDRALAEKTKVKSGSLLQHVLLRIRVLASGQARASWCPLECMFKVRIYDDRPLAPEILIFRPL